MKIGVISDTHIPSRARQVPDQVFDLFEGVDAVIHAGDVVNKQVLIDLRAIAPLHAVLGNCDPTSLDLPETLVVDAASWKVGVIHDSGGKAARRRSLRHRFPECRVVVFGHSHQPMIEDDGDLLLVNPGSACDPRFARVPTVAMLDLAVSGPKARLIELR
ncbi:MAG: metallophosphoesterase family protein [Actinomycetota bacterium]|nr:metallophosphatase family protein [Actinomycetota bacterium]